MQSTLGHAGNAASQLAPQRPLETIGDSANRVMIAAERVAAFIDRFHGDNDATGQPDPPISVSYSSNLARLYGNLDTLEGALNALEAIG